MRKILEQINPVDLDVNHSYQRPLRKSYKRIAAHYDPLLVGTIILSRHTDGTIWILDGQHRVAAAKEKGILTMDALIYEGLTLEQEAHIFTQQNHTRIRICSYDLYIAGQLNRTSIYYALYQIARDNGTPIVKLPDCGPRTIGLYVQKIEQFGAERTKQVFQINKRCNKRYDIDLYNEKVQRAIYNRLATESVPEVIRRINAIENLREIVARSFTIPLADYGNLI